MTQRRTPEDWLAAGFRILVEIGPQALKAEVIARALGTTKGSFYWHFKDVPSYRASILALWHAKAVTDIIATLEQIEDPKHRLRALGTIAATPAPEAFGGKQVEAAIRAWGLSDNDVARAVAEVDADRIAYLGKLLQACNVDPTNATLLYAGYVGLDQLAAQDMPGTDGALSRLIALLLGD